MSERRIKLTVDSSLDDVFLIGLTVNKICSYIRLTELECYQMEVSVVEGVNNAIRHAYGAARGHEVEVEITLHNDRILFCVRDTGKQMAESSLEFCDEEGELRDFHNLSEGGRGLFIVKSYMDEVSYSTKDGCNCFTMVKSLAATAAR